MNDINFYVEEANQGETLWPFLNFCFFFAGIIIMVYGIVNFVSAWREFRLFYDASALEEKPNLEMKKKKMLKHGIISAVGIIMFIVSFFLY